MMFLEYRTNNAYDSVILVDELGMVRSDWTVDRTTIRDFCDCSKDAEDWDDHRGDEYIPEDYGVLVARRVRYELHAADVRLWADRVEFHLH